MGHNHQNVLHSQVLVQIGLQMNASLIVSPSTSHVGKQIFFLFSVANDNTILATKKKI